MKFLADESIDFPIIHLLRQHGFDIRSVSEEFPSRDDEFGFIVMYSIPSGKSPSYQLLIF